MKTMIPCIIASLLILSSAHAGQRDQNQRLRQGIHSGSVTREEAKDMRQNRREMHVIRNEAMADGELDKTERKEIRNERRKNSKELYDVKHNEAVRE